MSAASTTPTAPAPKSTWVKVTNQFQALSEHHSQLTNYFRASLTDTLLSYEPTQRNTELNTYIAAATENTKTHLPLFISLRKALSLIDQARNIQHADEPETYASIHEQLTDFLLDLKQNIPSSGNAKTALETLFQTIGENIHTTLAIFFREQGRQAAILPLETRIQEQTQTIQNKAVAIESLERHNEELATQNTALRAIIDDTQKQTPTKGFLNFLGFTHASPSK